jgi:hypothetical protein
MLTNGARMPSPQASVLGNVVSERRSEPVRDPRGMRAAARCRLPGWRPEHEQQIVTVLFTRGPGWERRWLTDGATIGGYGYMSRFNPHSAQPLPVATDDQRRSVSGDRPPAYATTSSAGTSPTRLGVRPANPGRVASRRGAWSGD